MELSVHKIWYGIVNAGTYKASSERERKDMQGMNIALLILILIQVGCLFQSINSHSSLPVLGTSIFIVLLCAVHGLMHHGQVNASKFAAIAVINMHCVIMAVTLGIRTHIIDFLLISAILPLYLFETKQWRMILTGIAASIGPYFVYTLFKENLRPYGLPRAEQLLIGNTSAWVMMFCIVTLLYLMYKKNKNYEQEAQQNEARLMQQKKLYEQILEQIPIGIVTFDKDLHYTYINSAAVKDSEMRAWLIGKNDEAYFKHRNLDMKAADERMEILKAALDKRAVVEVEQTMTDRHGQLKSSLKGAAPVYNDDRTELLTLIGYSMDITSIKDAERQVRDYAQELERRNGELQHFVYATSHDLKSPLRNISSHLQILQRRNKENLDAESVELINYTVQSVKHLNQLINDIYQYSVADSNDKPTETVNLINVVSTIISDHRTAINERNAKVEYSNLPELKLAPSHISMVLTNLISNAIKYNQAQHPMVHVYSHESDSDYIFTVADNGIGIPEEYHKQIFEIFRRLHTADTYEGTGVGLAICKKIVENYGGKIWVESEQGKGSKFRFSLAKNIVAPNYYSISQYNEDLAATG